LRRTTSRPERQAPAHTGGGSCVGLPLGRNRERAPANRPNFPRISLGPPAVEFTYLPPASNARLVEAVVQYRRIHGVTDTRTALGEMPQTREERAAYYKRQRQIDAGWASHDRTAVDERVVSYAEKGGLDPDEVFATEPPELLDRHAEWEELRTDRDQLIQRVAEREDAERASLRRYLLKTEIAYAKATELLADAPPGADDIRGQLEEQMAGASERLADLRRHAGDPRYASLIAVERDALRQASEEVAQLEDGTHPGLAARARWEEENAEVKRQDQAAEATLQRHKRLRGQGGPDGLPPEPEELLGSARLEHARLVGDIAEFRTLHSIDDAEHALGGAPFNSPEAEAERQSLQERLETAWQARRERALAEELQRYAARYRVDPDDALANEPDPLSTSTPSASHSEPVTRPSTVRS
jgi:hypothetical protein